MKITTASHSTQRSVFEMDNTSKNSMSDRKMIGKDKIEKLDDNVSILKFYQKKCSLHSSYDFINYYIKFSVF